LSSHGTSYLDGSVYSSIISLLSKSYQIYSINFSAIEKGIFLYIWSNHKLVDHHSIKKARWWYEYTLM